MHQEIIRLNLGGVNAYLLKQNGNCLLVDTGGSLIRDKQLDNRRALLLQLLSDNGCSAENLKLVILTHGDCDHTANAAFLRKQYGVKIAMHSADIELVDNPTLEKMMETFRYRSALLKFIFLLIKGKITRIMQKTREDFEGFEPDILLNEGNSLAPYGFDAKILALPGHTKGSIGILTTQDDLISGDIIVSVDKPAPAPNAFDFKQLDESINRIKTMSIQTVYPGHGEPFAMKDSSL
ncbi:MBL fold metallo-hydrolase [Acetanaerobacterium elongatum]|uniref:Glyoxylase, beta-lactamase superfamily II n=1 Tax=Acetanaerobacterium elongatum TaxID=258515 RepID=A0A1H0F6Q4_9FIRM|nr:MBL fold metallo-hydrolase [Acetanaerobacterium elongatum]SDN90328.1 Glyoxylase, beta-lactamase superfamily II [Acetanaerobacterium elongatum]